MLGSNFLRIFHNVRIYTYRLTTTPYPITQDETYEMKWNDFLQFEFDGPISNGVSLPVVSRRCWKALMNFEFENIVLNRV